MVRINIYCRLAMLFALLLAIPGAAAAQQSTGSLEIRVIDADDTILPGATVKILTAGSDPAVLMTDEQGKAAFAALQCDRLHSLAITFTGFVQLEVTAIEACGPTPTNLVVCLDQLTIERLVLIHRAPLVDIDNMRVSTIYSSQFLQDLPGYRGDSGVRPPRRAKGYYKRCRERVSFTSSSSTP
jgi:hypothetical protein